MNKLRMVWTVGMAAALFSGAAFGRMADMKLCKDLGQLKSAATALQSLPPQAPISEVKAAAQQVKQAGQQVAKQAAKDPNAQNLSLAINGLRQSVDSLPSNVTGPEAKAQLGPQVAQVRSATMQYAATHCQR